LNNAYLIFKLNVSYSPIQENIFFQFPIFFISKQMTLMSENNKGISFALSYQVNESKRSENEPGTDAVCYLANAKVDGCS
jgi:hypothetical protein